MTSAENVSRAAEIARLLSRLAELFGTTDEKPPQQATLPPERVLLTVEEAAQRLRIGRTRMFELVKSGAVASVRIGRLRRISVESINAYAASLIANRSAA
jgi:excisionase family DNA binding protein